MLKCHKLTHISPAHTQPFFWDHPGEPVPEENFWTWWCKGRLTEADTPTIQLVATPSAKQCPPPPPPFFTGRMPFLPRNQQCQITEGNWRIRIREKTLEFSSMVLPAPSPYHKLIITIQIGLTFLALAYTGCPAKEAVKRVSVSVNTYVSITIKS